MNTRLLLLGIVTASIGLRQAAAQPLSGQILWTFHLPSGGRTDSSPALATDGTVYVNGLAITNNGTLTSNKWSVAAGAGGGTPVVGSHGTIYYRNDSLGGLTAVNPDGSIKWKFPASGGSSIPAIGADGMIYFQDSALHAVSRSGDEIWKVSPPGGHPSPPVVGYQGHIYVGFWEFYRLYSFAPDGSKDWTLTLRQSASDSPCVAADGTVFVANDVLSAFSPDGTNLWSAGRYIMGSPVIGPDGTVYASTSRARSLVAFGSEGQPKWEAFGDISAPSYGYNTSPAIDAAGTIFYCLSNSLWALNPGGHVQWKITSPEPQEPTAAFDLANSSPIIGPDGTIYAVLGSTIYAVASGTNGPANSPWPMYRGNAQHTGRIQKPVLSPPKKRSDANFQFELYGDVGKAVTVQASTNLSTWTSLTSLVTTAVDTPVVDLTASNSPAKFYRVTGGP